MSKRPKKLLKYIMASRIFFYISAILCLPFYSLGQAPCMTHYTIEDGLPSNIVYRIYSDSQGFLWFATDKGVARYNGLYFQTFTTADGLPDNEVFSFQEDHEKRIWLATFNGKLCYFKDEIFHTEKNTPWMRNLPVPTSLISYITLEKDSSITIQFNFDTYFLNIKGERINKIDISSVIEKFVLTNFERFYYVRKKNENVYEIFSIKNKIEIDNRGTIRSTKYYSNKSLFRPIPSSIETLLSFNDTIYNAKEKKEYIIVKRVNYEYLFFLKDGNTTFFGRDSGLYINDSIHLFQGSRIASITKDFQGNYWVSPYGDGAYMLNANFRQTAFYPNAYQGNVRHALTSENIPCFITERGLIYRKSEKQPGFELAFTNKRTKASFDMFKQLILPGFKAIIIHPGYAQIVNNLNSKPKARLAKNYNSSPKYLFYSNKTLYNLGRNYILKVKSEELENNSFTNFDTVLYREAMIDRLSSGALNDNNELWYSIADSIFRLNDDKAALFIRYPGKIFRKMQAHGDYVVAITHDNLLVVFNKKSRVIKTDTFSNSSSIWSDMIFVDDHHLLVSSNKHYYLLGLAGEHKLQPLENIFLPLQPEYMYADNEYCYFFKKNNITRITKQYLYKEPSPKVVFSNLQTQNKRYNLLTRVNIPYKESKNIKLAFSAISFCSKNLNYQFSLSDKEQVDNWQDTKGEELNLLTPSYGNYIIKIRAKTASSDYSEPAVLVLNIADPYWATWWFWTALALSITGITWSIVKWRTKRILSKRQQEFETEKRYQQAEYKALNALMNPHFIFNSMNNIQGLINEDEKQTANEYLVIFSEMIRQNMHNIDQGTISLHKELVLCRNYLELEKLRFKELINFVIEVDNDIDTEDILIPPLLIQPLIENAIRHGLLPRQSKDSMVSIRITENNNLLTIEIEDNGIGLTRAAQNKSSLHPSTGISNMQKRIEHISKMKQKAISFNIMEMKNNGIVNGTLAVIKIELE